MLNILYVFGGEKASGAERVIYRLIQNNTKVVKPYLFISPGNFAETLVQNSHEFEDIIQLNQLRKLNRSNTNKLVFYACALKNYLTLPFIVLQYALKNDIKIVHANTIVPSSYLLPAVWIAKLLFSNIRWIWTDHDLKYFSKQDEKLSFFCVQSYNLTLAVSDAVKKKYTISEKICTLYNGLNINEFVIDQSIRKNFRSKLELSDNTIVLGIAATIEPRKGQLMLINTFLKLRMTYTNIHLIIAGGVSNDHLNYVKLVSDSTANNVSISYLGRIVDMEGFYNACDIVINNSSNNGSEPLGTTIYEAMAYKKVLVASNTGGTNEIISNDIDGYLFNADDEQHLYQRLSEIIGKVKMIEKISQNAREKVQKKFNIELIVKNYNSLISNL